jgi:hypothetical protein
MRSDPKTAGPSQNSLLGAMDVSAILIRRINDLVHNN